MYRLTDHLEMTIVDDWDVNQHSNKHENDNPLCEP